MFRPTSRSLLQCTQSSLAPARTGVVGVSSRRFLGTSTPPHLKSRSWKGTFARWGLAGGAVYFYSTSELFAEQPSKYSLDPKADYEDEDLEATHSKLSSLTESARAKKQQVERSILGSIASEEPDTPPSKNTSPSAAPPPSSETETPSSSTPTSSSEAQSLEDSASEEGAFNPETGEINWDCPCLGGMAHGPCGEEFRAAFSCFVFSQEEQKGIDCIDKFKGMQECFRRHPDVYADELAGDDEIEEEVEREIGARKDGLDEGEEERRQELIREIRERRRQNAQAGGSADNTASEKPSQPTGEKRLLEVDPPVERRSLLKKASERAAPPSQSAPTAPPSPSPKPS